MVGGGRQTVQSKQAGGSGQHRAEEARDLREEWGLLRRGMGSRGRVSVLACAGRIVPHTRCEPLGLQSASNPRPPVKRGLPGGAPSRGKRLASMAQQLPRGVDVVGSIVSLSTLV